MSPSREHAFKAALASSIAFFVVCIFAIIFGLAFGSRFHVPSLLHATGPTVAVYFAGLAFPAVTAFCLLCAWVRFSGTQYRQTIIYAFVPWAHFAVFMMLLTVTLHR